jgi:hypothetical protein
MSQNYVGYPCRIKYRLLFLMRDGISRMVENRLLSKCVSEITHLIKRTYIRSLQSEIICRKLGDHNY